MPYIQARLSVKLNDAEKDSLQKELTKTVAVSLSKPSAYIMTEIVDDCSLYMSENSLDRGAYVSVKALGNLSKDSCNMLSKSICDILASSYQIEPSKTYITFHPVDLWGWNGGMF